MHNKNNNKTQNYIQGLRPFSNSIPKNLKKYLKKSGYNYSNIVDNWTKMVSKKISDVCYPVTVKMEKGMKDGNLIINVVHGKEMEIEYAKSEIIDKINSFFGFDCIKRISLKIVEDKIMNKNKMLPRIKDCKKIDEKIKKVNDARLKKSLSNFLKAYHDRSK